jgi:hypothetical protein
VRQPFNILGNRNGLATLYFDTQDLCAAIIQDGKRSHESSVAVVVGSPLTREVPRIY